MSKTKSSASRNGNVNVETDKPAADEPALEPLSKELRGEPPPGSAHQAEMERLWKEEEEDRKDPRYRHFYEEVDADGADEPAHSAPSRTAFAGARTAAS